MKKIILLLCVVCLLTLMSCKQDTTKHSLTSSGNLQSQITSGVTKNESDNEIVSGTQLEEDIFEYDNSKQDDKKEDSSTQEESSKDNTSSVGSETTQNGQENQSSEDVTFSDQEETETESDDITVEDGIVKLPVDKFD